MESSIDFLHECFPFAEIEILKFLIQENSLESCFKILLNEEEEEIEPLLIIQKKTRKELVYRIETESELRRLKDMFTGFHENAIENVYTDCDGDFAETARILSENLSKSSSDVGIRDRNALNELRMLFPSDSISDKDLISAFYSSEFDMHVCTNILLNNLEPQAQKSVWNNSPLPNPSKPIIDFHPPKSTTQANTLPSIQSDMIFPQDPKELRNQIATIARERIQLLEQARSYFKQGSLTGRSAASFYAERARNLSVKMTFLKDLASKSQLKLNSMNQDPHTIDLHGLTVTESIQYLKVWVQSKSRKDGWFKIITGAGNNSEGGRAKLLPAVTTYMNRIGWKIDESKSGLGWIVVRASD